MAFTKWSGDNKPSLSDKMVLLRLVLLGGILGYVFGTYQEDDENSPIVIGMGAAFVTFVFMLSKFTEATFISVGNSPVDSLDFLIIGSLMFAIVMLQKKNVR